MNVKSIDTDEDVTLPEDVNNALVMEVREMRAQLGEKLRAQAVHLQRLEETLKQLREEQSRFEAEAWEQFAALGNAKPSSPSTPLDDVLSAVRNLLAATSPKQLFSRLTEEGHRMGVRAVLFEVRCDAAWAASAHGFGPSLTEQTMRSLVVPLSVDTPFRQVFELGLELGGNPEVIRENPNVLSRLKPDSQDSILLLPIRACGAVAAIFYADSGGRRELPENAVKLLVEYAGAQLDRLRALADKARAVTDCPGPSV